jgi:hypothetical protein
MMKNKNLVYLALIILVTGLAACSNASIEPLPRSMKGYELYSWQEEGQWRFTLITGTNRNKIISEIVIGESEKSEDGWVNLHTTGVSGIKDILNRVPEGEWVSWSGGNFVTEPEELSIRLELPPQDIIDEIKAYAEKQGLNFQVF